MSSFMSKARKTNIDLRTFIREANRGTGLKYIAESDAKHILYIPYIKSVTVDENGTESEYNQIINVSARVHEWNGLDGRYRSCVCLDGVNIIDEDKNVINDGTCPICERMNDAWEIYKMRIEKEKDTCGLYGDDLTKHMNDIKGDFSLERKAKEPREYIYILVAKFNTNNNLPVINRTTGQPEYELKIMKLSTSRSENIMKAIENGEAEMPGAEIMIHYPKTDDARLLSRDSVTTLIYENHPKSIISKYKGIADTINKEASLFTFDGIEKTFPEWRGMSTSEAKKTMSELFRQYDEYKSEIEDNPDAVYLEYSKYEGGNKAPTLIDSVIPRDNVAMPNISNKERARLAGGRSAVNDINSVFSGDVAPL